MAVEGISRLNFPEFDFRVREVGKSLQIFDAVRKKFVPLTPEEWVRQHLIRYLCDFKNVPTGLIGVEVAFLLNGVNHRADVVVYGRVGKPLVVVECKAADVELSESTVDQVVRYNSYFKAPYLVITNGIKHYTFAVSWESGNSYSLNEIPDYSVMEQS
ncbi:MAG TPA: type I restriction enzyme HsdR N-terminal domain-containing protein [Tenuifilaceae bacterium]|nr:type I restriction enzyme HsdR N-terminal domain-containing protein [Tenuifilaceae bacterium]